MDAEKDKKKQQLNDSAADKDNQCVKNARNAEKDRVCCKMITNGIIKPARLKQIHGKRNGCCPC